jgi:YqaJ-like recombinase protein
VIDSRITVYQDLIQGSDEWTACRKGMLTASEMHHIITPTGKPAKNEKMRAHAYELLAQRITGHVEPSYYNDDMLRGQDDEIDARTLYSERYAQVVECGFIVRDFGDFKIGYSPDGLVGDDGAIEVKGRRQKLQVQTIINGEPPAENMMQVQTGLLVSGRAWVDFLSYSGGLPMAVYRVLPDETTHAAILDAAAAFEQFIGESGDRFLNQVATRQFYPTARRVVQEMIMY